MVGGLPSSAFLTLELIPVAYPCWRYAQLRRAKRTGRPLVEIIGLTDAGP
jgi:Cu(I)/Ag(I) efflux system membrane protein CusA/SilA